MHNNIINNPVEGKCQIKVIKMLKKSYNKIILTVLLTIITAGIFALFLIWLVELRKLCLYNLTNKI
jgi:hypothetical protein